MASLNDRFQKELVGAFQPFKLYQANQEEYACAISKVKLTDGTISLEFCLDNDDIQGYIVANSKKARVIADKWQTALKNDLPKMFQDEDDQEYYFIFDESYEKGSSFKGTCQELNKKAIETMRIIFAANLT